MSLRIIVSSFIAFFLILSCSSTTVLPAINKGDRIEFGNGGGFTGLEERFVLYDNGFIMKKVMGSDSLTLVS